MKLKLSLLCVFLLLTVAMSACGASVSDTTPTQTTPFTPDPFVSLRASGEEWISYGLDAYEENKPVTDLKAFFSNPSNIVYLTLYDHMFTYAPEASVPVAEALFRFIYDTYGADALLDTEKRIEYKTAYLQSLGLSLTYSQNTDVEQVLISMDCSSNDTYPYIITIGNASYYFEDLEDGAISQYHGFLYYNTVGLRKMTEYIRTNCGGDLFDTERKLDFYMTFAGVPYSVTTYTGDMQINDFSSALHEAVHAMGIRAGQHIWLSEGLCNYLGRALGFNDQITAVYVQELMMTKQGYYDAHAEAGDKVAIFHKAHCARYESAGGQFTSLADFNLRLYFDTGVSVELESGQYDTLGHAYETINGKACTLIGRELSYSQATSLTMYLVDTYGIDTVLRAQQTQNIEAAFGKSYESLKADWLAYLQ